MSQSPITVVLMLPYASIGGRAQEAVVDVAGLRGGHHVVHELGGHRPVEGARIAHRDGQHRHLRPHPAGLEDDQQVRRVGALGQHRRDHRQAGAHEDRAVVLQQARQATQASSSARV